MIQLRGRIQSAAQCALCRQWKDHIFQRPGEVSCGPCQMVLKSRKWAIKRYCTHRWGLVNLRWTTAEDEAAVSPTRGNHAEKLDLVLESMCKLYLALSFIHENQVGPVLGRNWPFLISLPIINEKQLKFRNLKGLKFPLAPSILFSAHCIPKVYAAWNCVQFFRIKDIKVLLF